MKNIRILVLVFVSLFCGAIGGVAAIYFLDFSADEPEQVVGEASYFVEESDLTSAIEKVRPAVVSIQVFKDFPLIFAPEFVSTEEVGGGSGFMHNSVSLNILTEPKGYGFFSLSYLDSDELNVSSWSNPGNIMSSVPFLLIVKVNIIYNY